MYTQCNIFFIFNTKFYASNIFKYLKIRYKFIHKQDCMIFASHCKANYLNEATFKFVSF
jgi:hypothetical protein